MGVGVRVKKGKIRGVGEGLGKGAFGREFKLRICEVIGEN